MGRFFGKKAWQKTFGLEEMIRFVILEAQAVESGLNMTRDKCGYAQFSVIFENHDLNIYKTLKY